LIREGGGEFLGIYRPSYTALVKRITLEFFPVNKRLAHKITYFCGKILLDYMVCASTNFKLNGLV
jgi:hypothetical protein